MPAGYGHFGPLVYAIHCVVEGCESPTHAWGSLCKKHYNRWMRVGTFRSHEEQRLQDVLRDLDPKERAALREFA